MSLTIGGKITGQDENHSISSAVVRLYRKDTGALVDSTTSDMLGDFLFTSVVDFDPYKYFVVAYHSDHICGISDVRKSYISFPIQIYKDIVDSNTDLIVVLTPSVDARVAKIVVESTTITNSIGSIAVYNAPNGGGDGIIVNITSGAYRWTNVGDITTTDYFYIRSITPANGMSNVSVTLILHFPELITPLGLGL